MANRTKNFYGFMVIALLALTAGCDDMQTSNSGDGFSESGSNGWSWMFGNKNTPDKEPAFPQAMLRKHPIQTDNTRLVRRPYRLRVADEVEIIYHVRTTGGAGRNYQIKPRDIITIKFPNNSDFDLREAEVPSDGKIQALLLDEPILVSGKTAAEVTADLKKRYQKIFRLAPDLTVTVKESKKDIADLRETITTSPRGMSRLVPVTPDGTIALPLIGSVNVKGLTVVQVRREVGERYRKIKYFEDLDVTVNIETVSPLRVYVLGEVLKPGRVLAKTGAKSGINELSVLQALALAGNFHQRRAELSKVLVIRKTNPNGPIYRVVNLYKMLREPDIRPEKIRDKTAFKPHAPLFANDIWLQDGDIVYVPTKKSVRRDDWIRTVFTEGIYRVIPFNFSTVLSFGGGNVDIIGPSS